ncbi:MAG: hypothetical protein V3T28_04375 [Gemmatimonadales bacterium]
MNTQRTDFLVGLFMLISVGIVVGALIATSGLGQKRYDLFIRITSAKALTQDTRVVLRGLSVGRVRQVSPVIDSTTGAITFVARLSLLDEFPNGEKLTLPVGTRAVISQPTPIAPAEVELVVPDSFPEAFLTAGDTIPSDRLESVLDALAQIANNARGELSGALADTRSLMDRTNSALRQTQSLMAANGPLIQEVLTKLSANLDRTNRIMAAIEPRIAPMHDSITVVLSDTRVLLRRMDSLVTTAHVIALENKDVIRETTALLLRSAQVLEHLADQVSRRPTRMLTGVRPPPRPDSTRNER